MCSSGRSVKGAFSTSAGKWSSVSLQCVPGSWCGTPQKHLLDVCFLISWALLQNTNWSDELPVLSLQTGQVLPCLEVLPQLLFHLYHPT